MVSRYITETQKMRILPNHIKEFNGLVCYQCENQLGPDYEHDHLNKNRNDNRDENIALICRSCNAKKELNSDMEIKAYELLKKREDAGLKFLEDKDAGKEPSEIEINKALFNYTKQFITERVNTDGNYLFNDALNEIVYLCQEKFGHGSEQTVRRYINQLTCAVAPYQIVRDDKNKKLICKRVLN